MRCPILAAAGQWCLDAVALGESVSEDGVRRGEGVSEDGVRRGEGVTIHRSPRVAASVVDGAHVDARPEQTQ